MKELAPVAVPVITPPLDRDVALRMHRIPAEAFQRPEPETEPQPPTNPTPEPIKRQQLPLPKHIARTMHRAPVVLGELPQPSITAEKPRRRRRGSTGRRHRAMISQIHEKHGVMRLEEDPLRGHRKIRPRGRIFPKNTL